MIQSDGKSNIHVKRRIPEQQMKHVSEMKNVNQKSENGQKGSISLSKGSISLSKGNLKKKVFQEDSDSDECMYS
jgi:hypothetical protein